MTRGGYISLIVIIVSLFLYNDFNKNSRLDRYEDIILSQIKGKVQQDTINAEISILKDSISEIGTILHSTSKTSDTVIKNTYVKNVFMLSEKQIETSDQNTDPIPISLTKSD